MTTKALSSFSSATTHRFVGMGGRMILKRFLPLRSFFIVVMRSMSVNRKLCTSIVLVDSLSFNGPESMISRSDDGPQPGIGDFKSNLLKLSSNFEKKTKKNNLTKNITAISDGKLFFFLLLYFLYFMVCCSHDFIGFNRIDNIIKLHDVRYFRVDRIHQAFELAYL